MFKYNDRKHSFRYRTGKFIEDLLSLCGMRSLDAQFLFSYVVMFLLTSLALGFVLMAMNNPDQLYWLNYSVFASVLVLVLLVFGRMFGLTLMMRQIKKLRDHLQIVH